MDSLDPVGALGQSLAAEELGRLRGFRSEVYRCLTRRADELFELTDALLCAEGPVKSLVGLCLEWSCLLVRRCIGLSGGIVEGEAAGAVESFLVAAGCVAVGQVVVLVVVVAGAVDGEA